MLGGGFVRTGLVAFFRVASRRRLILLSIEARRALFDASADPYFVIVFPVEVLADGFFVLAVGLDLLLFINLIVDTSADASTQFAEKDVPFSFGLHDFTSFAELFNLGFYGGI